jgi:hypothetical protein
MMKARDDMGEDGTFSAIPRYNKDGSDVKCYYCNGAFPNTKGADNTYHHADCV